jgi:hypothetical protein
MRVVRDHGPRRSRNDEVGSTPSLAVWYRTTPQPMRPVPACWPPRSSPWQAAPFFQAPPIGAGMQVPGAWYGTTACNAVGGVWSPVRKRSQRGTGPHSRGRVTRVRRRRLVAAAVVRNHSGACRRQTLRRWYRNATPYALGNCGVSCIAMLQGAVVRDHGPSCRCPDTHQKRGPSRAAGTPAHPRQSHDNPFPFALSLSKGRR